MHDSAQRDLNFHAARVPALDGIRGIAILLVFAVHTTPILLLGGRIGVDLFFVLSGFLITSILLQEQRQTGTINLKNFYMRRLLRLSPAILLMTAFVVAYAYLMQPEKFDLTLWNAFGTLFYWFNWQLWATFPNYLEHQWMFSHVWSLSVEEQFYIVWPAIVIASFAFGGSVRLRLVIIALGILGPSIARAVMWLREPSLSIYFNTFYRLDGLMWGALAATLIDARMIPRNISPHLAVAGLTGLLLIAWPEGLVNGFLYVIGFALVGLCASTLIVGTVINPSPLLLPILTFAPLRWVGKISYGLYLWHWPIIRAVSDMKLSPLPSMLIEFSLTFAVSAASFYLIEKHFLAMKKHFSVSKTERVVSV